MCFGALSLGGCMGDLFEDGNKNIDATKVQIYVGTYDGGYGQEYLQAWKKEFEELHKDDEYVTPSQTSQSALNLADAGELTAGMDKAADKIYIDNLNAYMTDLPAASNGFAAALADKRAKGEKIALYDAVWQAGTILLPIKSVGVMGDERTYEYTIALRAVTSNDGMTADWVHLPYDFLARVSNEIINKVKGVNRVVYDISSKPPATIEWE